MVNKQAVLIFADRVAVLAFMVMAFFIPTSNSAVEICFGVILFSFVLKLSLEKSRWEKIKNFFSDRTNLALLAFFVFIGISLFASGDLLGKSAYAWLFKWGERILLFCFAQIFLDKKHIRTILIVFLVTAFVSGVSGMWQKVTGYDFLRGFEAIGTGGFDAIRATFNHSNDFAVFLATMFFIALGFIQQEKNKVMQVAFIALSCLLIINLWFTYSRGGWLAFMVGLSLLALLSGKRVRFAALVVFIFMVMGLGLLPVARERIIITFQPGGDMSRGALWTGAFSMFRSSPVFGAGVGLFMDRIPDFSTHEGQYAHNSYLQILAETGILGLGAFFWFLWELFPRAFKRFKEEKDPLLAGMFLGAIVFMVHSFFDTHFYSLRLSMFFWMLAGMTCVYSKEVSAEEL